MANGTLGLGLFDECKKYEIIYVQILCKFKQPMTLSESVPLAPKQFHFSKIDCLQSQLWGSGSKGQITESNFEEHLWKQGWALWSTESVNRLKITIDTERWGRKVWSQLQSCSTNLPSGLHPFAPLLQKSLHYTNHQFYNLKWSWSRKCVSSVHLLSHIWYWRISPRCRYRVFCSSHNPYIDSWY